MEEHVVVRELAVLMSSKDESPLQKCLFDYAASRRAKLVDLMGRISGVSAQDEAMVCKFAQKFKSFCEGMAAVIPIYLNEEAVFVEFYNLPEIAVQVT